MKRLSAPIRAVMILMSLVAVMAGSTLQSASAADHRYDSPCQNVGVFVCSYDVRSHQSAPQDDGGEEALAKIDWTLQGGHYLAAFQPYSEVVFLEDGSSDGHVAQVDVIYFGKYRTYKWRYWTGTNTHIQLGKDHNLAENRPIMIRVCIQSHNCSPFATGRT